ncbi:glycosyltransferase [Candidatus Micrarchaeota archaeon]|nr:glycosyltransferase [Candidatus Micrarchaeota archaeon]
MKIAIFTDTYLPQRNGVVSYLLDATGELSKKHKVIIFAPGGKKLRVERKNVTTYWIPSSPFPFYEGYKIASMNYARVNELIKKEMPDIIHAHAPVVLGVQGIICAKRKGIPLVITHHTHFPDYVPYLLNGKLPEAFEDISGYTVKKLIRHVFTNADVVTAPTNELAKELRSYGLNNVVHLPNGVKLKKFKRNPKKGNAFRKKLGIPQNKKIILYLGRVSFEKKLDMLLHAFSMIDNAYLVIAGTGPYLEDLKKLAETLGVRNVRFTGFLKDIVEAYSAADIFASPSDTETFGLTFVEAMQSELPVVGVSKLGAREIIQNGKTGYLVTPGKARAFASALEKLLKSSDLRKKFAKNGKERAKEYSLSNSIKKTEEIYKRVRRSTP